MVTWRFGETCKADESAAKETPVIQDGAHTANSTETLERQRELLENRSGLTAESANVPGAIGRSAEIAQWPAAPKRSVEGVSGDRRQRADIT
ncbi:hypothetical protein NDU88_004925 [Pleurodeles waltl]|uniref:Uncharacterized protein n=1 Tax=Pleurodeles waltl TaxID=8319 RepID=A0AAV7SK75_PLEWA|nr:hypothetical protein NDU88_004925 [Pleurodeles waltl]